MSCILFVSKTLFESLSTIFTTESPGLLGDTILIIFCPVTFSIASSTSLTVYPCLDPKHSYGVFAGPIFIAFTIASATSMTCI